MKYIFVYTLSCAILAMLLLSDLNPELKCNLDTIFALRLHYNLKKNFVFLTSMYRLAKISEEIIMIVSLCDCQAKKDY